MVTSISTQPIRSVTVDVEEYFHIEAAYGTVKREHWNNWPSRVERSVELLLNLFSTHRQRGTFFVLGDVARRNKGLVRRIADAGHEIGSHGTGHDRLHRLTPATFRDDLNTSRKLLEDETGKPVVGYRAPTFSIVPQTAWAVDVLLECGFKYDSSIFPVRHPSYGVPAAPPTPFWVTGRSGGDRILEVPPLTWRVAGKQLAVAGGGYFRLLPLTLMRRGLRQAAKERRPAVLYFHPWEFDPDIPRMPLKLTGRIRTYTGLRTAAAKLASIMSEPAAWTPMSEAYDAFALQADQQETFCLAEAERATAVR